MAGIKVRTARAMFLAGLVPGAVCAHAARAQEAPAADRPNIIVLLADDMGYSDTEPYGSEIPTPNIKALAESGIKFRQFYNEARCSPSRASLLSGLYPHQAGLGNVQGENGKDTVEPPITGTLGQLNARATTVSQVLHDAGYYTAMAGKWHVGSSPGASPENRGFDAGLVLPSNLYWPNQPSSDPGTSCGQQKPVIQKFDNVAGTNECFSAKDSEKSTVDGKPKQWYASELIIDWAKKYIGNSGGDQPFFLYLPFTGPHFPVMARQGKIDEIKSLNLYSTAATAGWQKLRDERLKRQIAAGLFPTGTKGSDATKFTYDWAKLSDGDRQRFVDMMTVYAADVSSIDDAVGRLTCWLKHTTAADLKNPAKQADRTCSSPTEAADAGSLFKNTVIIFLSDNGSSAEGGVNGSATGSLLGSPGSNVNVGLNIATVNNAPFAYVKHYVEEGGIATPLIVSWPKGITSHQDITQAGHVIDIMPTLVDIANSAPGLAADQVAAYPTGGGILPEQGTSFFPAFAGGSIGYGSRPLFWNHESNAAVRMRIKGPDNQTREWKAVSQRVDWLKKTNGDVPTTWRLYNLSADPAETTDLACTRSTDANARDAYARLTQAYTNWAHDPEQFVDLWTAPSDGGVAQPANRKAEPPADVYQKICTG